MDNAHTDQVEQIVAKMTKAQREAAMEGRVHDCPYNHPEGTRCPNCASWPFKKGGAAGFVSAVRQHLLGAHDHAD